MWSQEIEEFRETRTQKALNLADGCSISRGLERIVLPNQFGESIRMGDLWADRLTVLVFLRHFGSVFSLQYIRALRDAEDLLRRNGAQIVAVCLGDRRPAACFAADNDIDFELLVDEGAVSYRAAGLRSASWSHYFYWDNLMAWRRARAAGLRSKIFGGHPYQLGGTFVFEPGNVDRYVFVNKTFSDNPDIDELLRVTSGYLYEDQDPTPTQRLQILTTGLKALASDLKSAHSLDINALRDLRDVLDQVRLSAWMASELMNAQRTVGDSGALLELLTAERLRRWRQSAEDLCSDIEAGRVVLSINGADGLLSAVKQLSLAFSQPNHRR